MADRDRDNWDRERDNWDRGREFGDRDREYGRGNDRERGYQDRDMMSRGADEVRSWFGDDEAQRRREMDEQRDWQQGRDAGANSSRVRREHGWTSSEQSSGSASRSPRSGGYGDQRDLISRGNEWAGRQYSPRGREWDDPNYGRGGGEWQGGSRGYGGQQSGSRASGWDSYGSSSTRGWGSDAGTTGEGRWAGQGSHAGRGPRSYQRSDDRIREDVNERLTADPRVDASDIDVRVQNGEVILSGAVDERRTRRLVEEIIEDLPGVRDVRNDLKVNKGSWFGGGQTGEQAREREDGALGHTGDPQKRDDVTTLTNNDPGKR